MKNKFILLLLYATYFLLLCTTNAEDRELKSGIAFSENEDVPSENGEKREMSAFEYDFEYLKENHNQNDDILEYRKNLKQCEIYEVHRVEKECICGPRANWENDGRKCKFGEVCVRKQISASDDYGEIELNHYSCLTNSKYQNIPKCGAMENGFQDIVKQYRCKCGENNVCGYGAKCSNGKCVPYSGHHEMAKFRLLGDRDQCSNGKCVPYSGHHEMAKFRLLGDPDLNLKLNNADWWSQSFGEPHEENICCAGQADISTAIGVRQSFYDLIFEKENFFKYAYQTKESGGRHQLLVVCDVEVNPSKFKLAEKTNAKHCIKIHLTQYGMNVGPYSYDSYSPGTTEAIKIKDSEFFCTSPLNVFQVVFQISKKTDFCDCATPVNMIRNFCGMPYHAWSKTNAFFKTDIDLGSKNFAEFGEKTCALLKVKNHNRNVCYINSIENCVLKVSKSKGGKCNDCGCFVEGDLTI